MGLLHIYRYFFSPLLILLRCRNAKSFCVIVPLLNPIISVGQLVVLQGQNLCKPVIATMSKGIDIYIVNGETGYIISKDKEELLKALESLKNNDMYKQVSEKEYKNFIQNLSVSKQFESIASIVKTIQYY